MINQLHAVITSKNINSFINHFYAGLPPGLSSESLYCFVLRVSGFISNSQVVNQLIKKNKRTTSCSKRFEEIRPTQV